MQKEKINIDFIQISQQAFAKGIRPAPADLEAFLKAREGQFRVPEQVQIKYLAFMGQDYAAKAKISDAEINEYYEKNRSQWKKGGQGAAPCRGPGSRYRRAGEDWRDVCGLG